MKDLRYLGDSENISGFNGRCSGNARWKPIVSPSGDPAPMMRPGWRLNPRHPPPGRTLSSRACDRNLGAWVVHLRNPVIRASGSGICPVRSKWCRWSIKPYGVFSLKIRWSAPFFNPFGSIYKWGTIPWPFGYPTWSLMWTYVCM